jgi:hypothetical protein
MKFLSLIEPLESRIAPATIINPYTVTFQEVNSKSATGATVQVQISAPLFTSPTAAAQILQFVNSSGGSVSEAFTGNGSQENLAVINLVPSDGSTLTAANGMNISVTVLAQAGLGGQRTVNVGSIQAANFSIPDQVSQNINLGSVYIQGNLGSISVGGDYAYPGAIQSLHTLSMTPQTFGSATYYQSSILGTINNMNVEGTFSGQMSLIGYQFGSITTLNIGTLSGDSFGDSNTGVIQFTGDIGKATIGNIVGTGGTDTGELLGGTLFSQVGVSNETPNPTYINSLHVTGSITGGAGAFSGRVIVAGNIGTLQIDSNLQGGSAGPTSNGISATHGYSGVVQAGSIGTATIGGSILGGTPVASSSQTADTTGEIITGSISSLVVKGNLDGTGGGQYSGGIQVNTLTSAIIDGSIKGGAGSYSGAITAYAQPSLFSFPSTSYGTIQVIGDIIGGSGGNSGAITSPYGGTISSLYISGGLHGGAGTQSGSIYESSIGTLSIGADVLGGAGQQSGYIDTSGGITSLSIGGNVTGSSGTQSGYIEVDGTLGTLSITGNLAGGKAQHAGEILIDGSLTKLGISGSVTGGTAIQSGYIDVGGNLGTMSIGQNLTGGSQSETGMILVVGSLGTGTIGGNLAGGNMSSKSSVSGSGYLQAGGIGSLTIDGNISSGTNKSGEIANGGAIRSLANIGSLTVDGAITGTAANPVYIAAKEGANISASSTTDLAIGSVTIDGAVSYMDLLAGYGANVSTTSTSGSTTTTDAAGNPLGNMADGSAQIGTVTLGSTIGGSNIVAGIAPDSNGHFGTIGDKVISGKLTKAVSSIANIIVAGQATTDAGSFGFVARSIGAVTVNKTAVTPVTPGTPKEIGASNIYVLEVA